MDFILKSIESYTDYKTWTCYNPCNLRKNIFNWQTIYLREDNYSLKIQNVEILETKPPVLLVFWSPLVLIWVDLFSFILSNQKMIPRKRCILLNLHQIGLNNTFGHYSNLLLTLVKHETIFIKLWHQVIFPFCHKGKIIKKTYSNSFTRLAPH